MSSNLTSRIRVLLLVLIPAAALLLASCGGSGSSSLNPPPPPPVNNSQALEVNSGISSQFFINNGLYTSVTLCVPGTSNCQVVPNILVDTGSEGLRVLSSAVTLQLPAVTDNSNNQLQNCVGFLDGTYMWGSVAGADIKMAGEVGSSVPIQIVSGDNPAIAAPNTSNCIPQPGNVNNDGDVINLGANGILGVGVFRQDCGAACAGSTPPPVYFLCPNGVCQVAQVPVNFQLQNPVWTFAQDNNGLMISLPSVPDTGAQTVAGSMVFGIGTQADNSLGSAQVLLADGCGNFATTYNGIQYSDSANSCAQGSFLDTGSDALYFLDHITLGIPDCTDAQGNPTGYYCPASIQQYTVINQGFGGNSGQVTLSVDNADQLFIQNNGLNAAFDNLGGDSGTDPASDYFDFGMPFFYGRNVFIGIEGQTGPTGAIGPYYAY